MQRTKIEWVKNDDGSAGYSWNPIKGICPEACFYCYGRRIYERFKLDPTPRLELSGGTPDLYSSPSRVFVCSTFELFHPVADEFRDRIFSYIVGSPHTFIILTKRPERIDRPMPPNVWLGVSLTGESSRDYERWNSFKDAEALVKFVSFEPLFRQFDIDELFDEHIPDWIIIGRLTGHGRHLDTPLAAIQDIRDYAAAEDIPLFMKNNLAGIWPGPLVQEFPKVTSRQPAEKGEED